MGAPDPDPIVVDASEGYFLGLGDWGASLAPADKPKCQASGACGSMHYRGSSQMAWNQGKCSPTYQTCTDPPKLKGWCCDENAQKMVAQQMTVLAQQKKPHFLLNVGDNFYWGGVDGAFDPQWQHAFEDIYSDPSLQIPWITTLGNHDYGGAGPFRNVSTQVAYHYWDHLPGKKGRWVFPGKFFVQQVQFQGFSLEIFSYDGNVIDANTDPAHKFCCGKYANPKPEEKWCQACVSEFYRHERAGQDWLEERLKNSKAEWKILLTHYPYGPSVDKMTSKLQQYGVQLFLAGHAHVQRLWESDSRAPDVVKVVTGAGGGAELEGAGQQGAYGFVSFHVSAALMTIDFVDYTGAVKFTKSIKVDRSN